MRVAGQKDLFYVEDQELDFNELFSTTPLGSNPLLKMPKCPRQISLQVHWLAVQGVQVRHSHKYHRDICGHIQYAPLDGD